MVSSALSGSLKKLEITTIKGDKTFKAMFNPASFSHKIGIRYDDDSEACKTDKATGAASQDIDFRTYDNDTLSFDLVIDGTGAVGVPLMGKKPDPVSKQIDDLKEVVYDYDGKKHQPNVLEVAWGDFLFDCRLDDMAVDYTLFQPGGDPLRAKVSLTFKGFKTTKEESKERKKSSPDLSHFIEVKAGDTLPLLCQKIYEQPRYYLKVAEFNGLDNFRQLKPGTILTFPPLT